MKTIYIDGGSTAFGMFDYEKGGWANRLHIATMQNMVDITDPTVVVNRAIPGRTLAAIARNFKEQLRPYASHGRLTTVLQVGVNEAKIYPPAEKPIISAQRFGEHLLGVCGVASEKTATSIVLVGPHAMKTDHATASGCILDDTIVASYGEIMRDVATQTGAAYVDTRALFARHELSEVLAFDGYHPNELGHLIISNAIQEIVSTQ